MEQTNKQIKTLSNRNDRKRNFNLWFYNSIVDMGMSNGPGYGHETETRIANGKNIFEKIKEILVSNWALLHPPVCYRYGYGYHCLCCVCG